MGAEFDPRDVRAQEEAEGHRAEADRLKQQIEVDDLKWLMADKHGRRFVWRVLEKSRVFANAFAGDAALTAFRCGEQNIGQWLLAELHLFCPEKYQAMVRENSKANGRRSAGS